MGLTVKGNCLAQRIRRAREDVFGAGPEGIDRMAGALGIPPGTWRNYEIGVTMPGVIMLELICLTGISPSWLLRGQGDPYPGGRAPREDAHGVAH